MDNTINSPKPNNFGNQKTKMIKIDTKPHFMLNYHAMKFEAFCLKNLCFYFSLRKIKEYGFITWNTELKSIELSLAAF